MSKAATPELARQLVVAAIERIVAAHKRHVKAQADPSSSLMGRDIARESYYAEEREFAWQWGNVAMLLGVPSE